MSVVADSKLLSEELDAPVREFVQLHTEGRWQTALTDAAKIVGSKRCKGQKNKSQKGSGIRSRQSHKAPSPTAKRVKSTQGKPVATKQQRPIPKDNLGTSRKQ